MGGGHRRVKIWGYRYFLMPNLKNIKKYIFCEINRKKISGQEHPNHLAV